MDDKEKKTIRQYYLSETKSCNFRNIPRASNDINDKLSFIISTGLDPFSAHVYADFSNVQM